MSFTVILQTNKSEDIKANKDITTITEMVGDLKEETSIYDPSILVSCSHDTASACNYLTIPEFKRSYFLVKPPTLIRNGLYRFDCHVDVLSSFLEELKNCESIVTKQSNRWNLYLDDGSIHTYQNPIVTTKNFPNGFSTPEFVLAVSGG